MISWQPSSGPDAASRRAAMLRRLRRYFETEDVLEVDTPALSTAAASDVQLESVGARSTLTAAPLYLHTSPEFHMKRLLAAGYPDIFSICRVFRDGEHGRRHQPEFTLAEWYRWGFGLGEMIQDTIAAVSAALGDARWAETAVVMNYRDAFGNVSGLDPVDATIDELIEFANADADLVEALGDERDDWLDLILATKISPGFAANQITVLQHYPASQAALAQFCPADNRVADRFELFVGSLELANGYVELTDASQQAIRMDDDLYHRERRGQQVRPRDKRLLAALESGLPSCAGVALGVERLHMVYDNTDDMRDVITFDFESNND